MIITTDLFTKKPSAAEELRVRWEDMKLYAIDQSYLSEEISEHLVEARKDPAHKSFNLILPLRLGSLRKKKREELVQIAAAGNKGEELKNIGKIIAGDIATMHQTLFAVSGEVIGCLPVKTPAEVAAQSPLLGSFITAGNMMVSPMPRLCEDFARDEGLLFRRNFIYRSYLGAGAHEFVAGAKRANLSLYDKGALDHALIHERICSLPAHDELREHGLLRKADEGAIMLFATKTAKAEGTLCCSQPIALRSYNTRAVHIQVYAPL